MITNILRTGAENVGIQLSELQLNKFTQYNDYLQLKNRDMNLTSVEGDYEIVNRHFIDSIAISKAVDFSNAKIIDIGTGAGFPGIPIKILDSSIEITLLDSIGKRIEFLKQLCVMLEVEAECIHGRAEELSRLEERRDCYDYAVSRALAKMNILCELCLPFVKPGGAFLAMKSSNYEDELKEAEGAIKALGGNVERVYDYNIGDIYRNVVVIRKLNKTPDVYPRRFAKIRKQPL